MADPDLELVGSLGAAWSRFSFLWESLPFSSIVRRIPRGNHPLLVVACLRVLSLSTGGPYVTTLPAEAEGPNPPRIGGDKGLLRGGDVRLPSE